MRIQSNVKGHIDLRLQSPYILVHGRNGGGKSAVVHSVELACFGGVQDAGGRDIKSAKYLKSVGRYVDSPVNSRGLEELCSHVSFEGGLSFSWPCKTTYGLINPLRITLEVMTGSTDKFLMYVLKNLDDDQEVELDYAGWDAVVKSHGSYREALIEMYNVCSNSIRQFQGSMRNHKIVQQWASATGDMVSYRSVQLLLEEDEKSLAEQKSMRSKVRQHMMSFVNGALSGLEEKMSRYIPDDMGRPKFWWLEGELRLGFDKGPVPSGAESVALGIALAAVTVPDESDSRHVWILPDRAYDQKTLGNLMRVLRSLFCRAVVVQSTVLPEDYDYIGSGWDLVEV